MLDGQIISGSTSEIFDFIVQRDATWQRAFETWCSQKDIEYGSQVWFEARKNTSYIMTGFPDAIRDITTGTSIVKCNFDIGEPLDEEKVLGTRHWGAEDWNMEWEVHRPMTFETEPPFPSWMEMRQEDAFV